MIYELKNGDAITIRSPQIEDAKELISVISLADSETLFLARNPGEFQASIEKEQGIIEAVSKSKESAWYVVECKGKIVGQCSVGLVRRAQRYCHRAEVAFVLLKEYCDLGIGGKMMEACLNWCRANDIIQVELDVVTNNERAIKMYQGFGFKIVGTLSRALRYLDGTYADEYKMLKQI